MNISSPKKHKQDVDYPHHHREDIQGLIIRGYKSLTAATFILLKITDTDKARLYFKGLAKNYITNAKKRGGEEHSHSEDPEIAVNIAFTGTGIKQLLGRKTLSTFSREFIEGMSFKNEDADKSVSEERTFMLGDLGNNHPANWHWGNEEKPVDCMLMLYAKNKNALDDLIKDIYCSKQEKGVEKVYIASSFAYDPVHPKEHFGFMDGISQPVIKGFKKVKNGDDKQADKQELINPGEFILGYQNEFNNFSPSPYVEANTASQELALLPGHQDKRDLGRNGTYLVFRQIEQHVEKFWDHLYKHSKESGASRTEKAVKLGAKMIGRWPDGRPLVLASSVDCPIPEDLNDFNYAETDKYGTRCPLGAHIRRTNPRDQVHAGRGPKDSIEMSKRHRMLRRGRIYGEPLDKDFDIDNMIHRNKTIPDTNANNTAKTWTTCAGEENEKTVRGLHFICLVSDIARQFEFVQNVWANTSTFGGLCNEVDPVISPRPTKDQPHCHEFTTPQEIIRNRYLNVPEFTTVVGGAYFFMPGINALKYIIA